MKPLVDCIQTTEEAIAFLRENRNSDRTIRRLLNLTGRQFKRLTRRRQDGLNPIAQAWVELLVRGLDKEGGAS